MLNDFEWETSLATDKIKEARVKFDNGYKSTVIWNHNGDYDGEWTYKVIGFCPKGTNCSAENYATEEEAEAELLRLKGIS